MGGMRDDEKCRLPWGPLSIAFFGMAFARAWLSIIFVGPDSGTPALPVLSHTLFDVAYVAFSLIVLALARRFVPYSEKRWAYAATLAGMLVASVAFVAQPADPGFPGVWRALGRRAHRRRFVHELFAAERRGTCRA